jgi:bifunctional non-homologous end joining protein LigD
VSLREYRKKRRFSETAEPKGKTGPREGDLRFVVQKHEASRLHYDFRLELDGVLKSWAVPKGPSLDSRDKRLAIKVEDHPLEYRKFEGTIPEGNYGAGTVMVWDQGTYGPVEDVDAKTFLTQMRDGLAKGHVRFVLYGTKLRGQFSLVEIKGRQKNGWLLIKHADAFARETDVTKEDKSAASGRGMEEIASSAPRRKSVNGRPARQAAPVGSPVPSKGKAKRGGMPHQVQPMLATLVAEPFDRADWLFEVKWDGFRAIAEVERGKVQLYSRNLISYASRFPSIVKGLAHLRHDAVLDGEIVALDAEGKSHFQLLQTFQKTGQGNLVFYVFDLLYLDGKDLRLLPLSRRKELLAPLLEGLPGIRLSEHVAERGLAFYEAVAREGLEGMIAKKADSPYQEGVRSVNWLKIKARKQQEAVIGGFTEPRGSRHGLGALVLGIFNGKELVYCGHTGGGFNAKTLTDMRARLDRLVQKDCPFHKKPKTNAPVHWVKPTLVCEVAFQEWTSDGIMRMPIFLGLREDKPPEAVHREMPKKAPKSQPVAADHHAPKKNDSPSDRNGRKSSSKKQSVSSTKRHSAKTGLPPGNFTNLDKVYWPDEGFTKGDLLAYYHAMAPFILPYLVDRPMSLNRHPNGIGGPSFFQKDVSKQPPPEWVKTVDVRSESKGTIKSLVCQDEETLLYVANLGCIEMNPWNSRLQSLDNPDYLIIDLDPQEVPFDLLVEAAQTVRRLLEKGCGNCYCKTSGKRGLHIYVPLGARYGYEEARRFAELLARLCHQELPKTTSLLRAPAQRKGRIYLDYLQNSRGQTIAAPYSVRPRAGAWVSTPLEWREVKKCLDPASFTMKTVPRRLEKKGDLWQPVLGKGFDLAKCLASLG